MQETEEWTIGRLLTWTTDYLKKHEAESPRLDAEVLLAHARQCSRIELYTDFDQLPDEDSLGRFRDLVRSRAAGTPVAYLVGFREFFSLTFRVTPDVLIPRPETEMLVIELVDAANEATDPLTIADVGTGSGILAICAAKQLPAAQVFAVDVSGPALEVARQNAETHTVTDRIEFLESDLLERIPGEVSFDYIVSNPPYLAESEFENVARDVREFEPRQALVAGLRARRSSRDCWIKQ